MLKNILEVYKEKRKEKKNNELLIVIKSIK